MSGEEEHLSREELVEREHQARLRELRGVAKAAYRGELPGSRGSLAVNSPLARARMVRERAGAVAGSLRAASGIRNR